MILSLSETYCLRAGIFLHAGRVIGAPNTGPDGISGGEQWVFEQNQTCVDVFDRNTAEIDV